MIISAKSNLLKLILFSCIATVACGFFFNFSSSDDMDRQTLPEKILEERKKVRDWIGSSLLVPQIPESLEVSDPELGALKFSFTLDPFLQKEAEKLLRSYRPDYGAIFMMDATTGRILAIASQERNPDLNTNLNMIASYPVASVFKVITAAAATDKAGLNPDHKIYFNGGNYTLYKKNVLSDKINKWTRVISLKEAFARSINTAFGRLSLQSLEPIDLKQYAEKFYFNKNIPSDFNVESGFAYVPEVKGYALTEVASGFNRDNKMSPVLGAMISAAIANDGEVVAPYLVDKIENNQGKRIYEGQALNLGASISKSSADKVKTLMEGTVVSGTSRRTFKKLVRDKKFNTFEFGGKTGHLTGDKPKGRVDWFVGYAIDGSEKIAIAALTVNKKFWTVKSSYMGQYMFRRYLENRDSKDEGEDSQPEEFTFDVDDATDPYGSQFENKVMNVD